MRSRGGCMGGRAFIVRVADRSPGTEERQERQAAEVLYFLTSQIGDSEKLGMR